MKSPLVAPQNWGVSSCHNFFLFKKSLNLNRMFVSFTWNPIYVYITILMSSTLNSCYTTMNIEAINM